MWRVNDCACCGAGGCVVELETSRPGQEARSSSDLAVACVQLDGDLVFHRHDVDSELACGELRRHVGIGSLGGARSLGPDLSHALAQASKITGDSRGVRCVHRMLVDSRTPARGPALPGMRRTARVLRLQAPHRVGPACLPRVWSRGVGPCVARDGRVMRPRARSASAEPCGSTAFMGATTSSSAESTCCRTHTRHY
jgi:hypothetical protein